MILKNLNDIHTADGSKVRIYILKNNIFWETHYETL